MEHCDQGKASDVTQGTEQNVRQNLVILPARQQSRRQQEANEGLAGALGCWKGHSSEERAKSWPKETEP